MIYASEELKKQLTSNNLELHVKINLMNKEEIVLEELTPVVIDGNISVDKNRDIRRNFSLTIDNFNNFYTPDPYGRIWLDKKLQVFIGIKLPDGNIEYIPQGVFILTKPVASTGVGVAPQVRLEGLDKMAGWGKITNNLALEKGVNIGIAIQQVLAGVETKFVFDDIDIEVPYDLTYQVGTDRKQIVKELADMAVWDIYYNVEGELRFKEYVEPEYLMPTWTYQAGNFSLYAGSEKEIDDSQLFNHIITIGASSQSSTVSAEAKYEDLVSPYSIPNIGDRLYIHNNGSPDPLITSVELAQARSDYELRRRLQIVERQRFNIAPNYLHEEGDVIEIIDDGHNTNDKYELLSFNISLQTSGMMSGEAWKVKNLF